MSKNTAMLCAQYEYQAALVEIKSIADEVRGCGHVHRSALKLPGRGKASDLLAKQFRVRSGHALFHSITLHHENDVPIQLEDRWINSTVAPDYMQ